MSLVDPVVVDDKVTTLIIEEAPESQPNATPSADDGLPEKFRGKSPAEIAAAYANLESELGRARNEIGTNRRLVDELLNLRREPPAKSQEPARQPVTPYDLTENPEEAITRVAKHVADERTAGTEARLTELENNLKEKEFEKRHPGYRDLARTPEFAQWVQATPKRIDLISKAAANDWDSGDELLSLWSEYQALKAPAPDTKDPKQEAAKAGLAKSGGSGANKVVNSGEGKKIYSREELARLYINNPEEYSRLLDSPELQQAYKEKRIR